MQVSPAGQLLVASYHNKAKELVLFDLNTGKELHRSAYPGGPFAFLGDGKRAFCSDKLQLFDLKTAKTLQQFGKHLWGCDVAVSPDGQFGLSCGGPATGNQGGHWTADCSLRLWDLDSGVELRRWEQGVWTRWDCCFSPDGKRAISACRDGTVGVFDVATGREEARIEAPTLVFGVDVSADGKHVVASCMDGVLRMYALPAAR
jgi:WD40 repeat protein